MGFPAARIGDMHTCPVVDPGPKPHVGGPIVTGYPRVLIGGLPAARIFDTAACAGPPDTISRGSITVMIGGKSAARMNDMTSHGGLIVAGCSTVWIGDSHYMQQQSKSCVIASCRNLIVLRTGEIVDESTLRQEMREIMGDPDHDFNTDGINPIHAQALLRRHGVETRVERNQTNSDLAELTNGGGPVLVGFRNPGHRVMLDRVATDSEGNNTFHVRDPASSYGGDTREMSETEFNNRYNQNAIVIVPE